MSVHRYFCIKHLAETSQQIVAKLEVEPGCYGFKLWTRQQVFLHDRLLYDAGLQRANMTRPGNQDGGSPEAWDHSLSLSEEVWGKDGRQSVVTELDGGLCSDQRNTAGTGGDMWDSHWVFQVPGCLHRVRHNVREVGTGAP